MSEPVNKKQGRVWDLSQEEKEQICQTFTLLDKDGDDVITIPDLEFLLISLGRLPFDNDLAQILAYGEPRSHGKKKIWFFIFTFYDESLKSLGGSRGWGGKGEAEGETDRAFY